MEINQCWLRRVVRNRHRHAIEQASRRWRGGRREDSARTRREILSTQVLRMYVDQEMWKVIAELDTPEVKLD